MQYLDLMQQSLDDIEQNLKTDITAVELSRAANFSLYHYYRLFQDAVGLPVKQYIIRRRLLWAIYEISCGQKLIDTALCYGFDTAAGFYKAFVKEFGCSPSAYRKRYPVNKPYRIDLQKEVRMMISKERVKNILTHWGLEKESFCHMVYEGSGAVNENVFRVGERYFLKAYVNIGTLRKNTAIAELLWPGGIFSADSDENAGWKRLCDRWGINLCADPAGGGNAAVRTFVI